MSSYRKDWNKSPGHSLISFIFTLGTYLRWAFKKDGHELNFLDLLKIHSFERLS